MFPPPPKYCSKRLFYLTHPTSNFHQKIIILFYSTYQNKSTELLRMSIILKKRKKFFLISENKVICKGPPPASFTYRGSWVQSLLWGAEGGYGFLATCLQLSGRVDGEQGCYLARCSLGWGGGGWSGQLHAAASCQCTQFGV